MRLHPEHGVNPTILKYQCPVHGNIWESGEIALLGYNKNKKAEMYSVAGLKPCEECEGKFKEGYVAFVGVDEEKSSNLKEPYRTGDIVYVKEEVVKNLFDVDLKGKKMAYADKKIIDALKEIRTEKEDE